jgi:TP901 family phage tail tape measure protein
VVQLASATHYSMADSATYLANAINQFGLKATDANRVTDLLAQSANASAVDVKDLAQTFAYVGPVAQAAGFTIEDVAKATSVMGNAGIKGSSAGTGLKAVLSSLVAPGDKAAAAFKLGYSIKDATGKTKPLQQQLVELRGKFKGLPTQQKLTLPPR